MIALDGDRITKEFLANYKATCPYTSVLYTTHSHTDENPRARLVFPLTRDLSPEEFVAVSRYLAQMLGIDFFDECSYQPNQLMYWPSSPQNGRITPVFAMPKTAEHPKGAWESPFPPLGPGVVGEPALCFLRAIRFLHRASMIVKLLS